MEKAGGRTNKQVGLNKKDAIGRMKWCNAVYEVLINIPHFFGDNPHSVFRHEFVVKPLSPLHYEENGYWYGGFVL